MYKCKSLQEFQLPWAHLPFLQNFIITKYLKQVDDDLSICMNERSPCGLSITGDIDLSLSRDQKVMTLLPPMEKFPIDSITVLFLLLKFDNSSSSVTRDKEICQVIMS